MASSTPIPAAPAVITGSNPLRPSRYEAPFQTNGNQSSQDRLLGYIREAVNEGEWFLKGQSGYRFVDASHRIMADIGFDELPPTLSKVSDNFIKRDVREMVGVLSNPRPISSFKCENQAYDSQVSILNSTYLGWYYANFVDRSIRNALQFSAVEGTGYLVMEWDPAFWHPGKGDITLAPLGVDAVLPIQINPETWDLQSAYAVVVRRQYPITSVIRRFPHFADRLTPDGENASRFRRMINAVMDRVSATVHNTYGSQRGYRGEDPAGRALITIYDIYILDNTINRTGQPMRMGIEGSPWEYTVPGYGSDLPVNVMDASGRPLTRRADYHDARMFPYRRHVIATRNTILYDDTSRWWHGRVPIVKFRLDDWPFEYCGIPITKEPAKIQSAVTSLLRAYDDSANARLRPPLTFDGNRTNPTEARAIDPRSGGQVIEASDTLGPVFKLLVDADYYNMQNDILPFIQMLRDEGSRLMGNHDLAALQKAGQIPSGDTIEKLEELAGPVTTDLSRNMEASMRDLGELFKAMVFEFYNARRRFQLLGPDGLTHSDYDFDPGELVPDALSLPGLPPNATRAERARAHMLNFYFHIVPNSIYQMTQSTRRLLMLQLARMGMPISPYTLMEQFDIPNPGRPPQEAITEIDKWKAWKKEELNVMIDSQMKMARAQMEMQAQQQQANPLAQLSGVIQQAVQAPTVKGSGSNPQGAGRPPSGGQLPHVETKDSGTRTTIAES